jgi:small GTP-binding protein
MDSSFSTYIVKLLIVGVSNVGKSSLTKRFESNTFSLKHTITKGMDLRTKIVRIKGYNVQLSLWDTAAYFEYQSLMPMYYKGALGAVIVLDSTESRTLQSLNDWIRDIEKHCSHIPIVIALNKIDLTEMKQITLLQVDELIDNVHQHWRKPIKVIETSAKDNINVAKVFIELSNYILDDILEEEKFETDD